MLKTKSIKAEPQLSDGIRISVMSKHTLADGTTPDPEISEDLYDEWWPELAPPVQLVGSYYKRGMAWDEFEEGYKTFLKLSTVASKVCELINLAQSEVVTVLCVEDQPDQCHRRLLAEECQLLEPNLQIDIH